MVIAVFGESCTGKSTIAAELKRRTDAEVFSGKDYLRLAKNEATAGKLFADMLLSHIQNDKYIIYVISEEEHMKFIPEKAVRVLVTADINVIKQRFAQRMHGALPEPVAAMLEKRHGSFDKEACDIHVVDGAKTLAEVCDEILAYSV